MTAVVNKKYGALQSFRAKIKRKALIPQFSSYCLYKSNNSATIIEVDHVKEAYNLLNIKGLCISASNVIQMKENKQSHLMLQ